MPADLLLHMGLHRYVPMAERVEVKRVPLPTAGPEALALSAEPASPSLGSCGTEPRPGEGQPAREKQPGGDEQREHEELRHNGQLVEE